MGRDLGELPGEVVLGPIARVLVDLIGGGSENTVLTKGDRKTNPVPCCAISIQVGPLGGGLVARTVAAMQHGWAKRSDIEHRCVGLHLATYLGL